MNKRTTKNFQPEEKLNNEQKADKKHVSPAIANALVIGSQSPRSPELVFARKMYLCVQLLGGQSDILSTIGSWRDTLPDEDVLEALDFWINDKVAELKSSLEYVIEWHNK